MPFGAGAATDIMARQLAPRMSQDLGQPIVIDNRPGATGVIGAEAILRSAPDGHTLVMGSVASHAISAAIRRDLPFDSIRDFTAIGRACTSTNFIVVHSSVPARTLPELVAYSKRLSGGVSYSSGGTGSSNHLGAEMIRLRTGANFNHMPYANVGQALNDVVAGHVPMMIYTVAVLPHVQAGRLRGIAVTAETRQPQAPEIPTAIEQGAPGAVANSWFALFGPAQMSDPIRDQLSVVLRDALAAPEIGPRLIELGLTPAPLPPAEMSRFLVEDIARWREVARAAGMSG